MSAKWPSRKRDPRWLNAAAMVLLASAVSSGCSRERGDLPDGPDSSQLPRAMTLSSPGDKPAADLARAVLSRNEKVSLSALLAAIERSGFGVREPELNNEIVRKPMQPSQGVAFMAGEVLAIHRLLTRGHNVHLDDLGAALAQASAPVIAPDPVRTTDGIRAGIRESAMSDKATVRFWARFIVELGKQGPYRYDLLNPQDSAIAQLDPVQTAFITLRLIGDLAGVRHKLSGATAAKVTESRIVRAGMLPMDFPPSVLALLAVGKDCNLGNAESTMMDATASATTFAFGELVNRFASEAAAKAVSKFTAAIGASLGFLKFFAVGALTEAKLELLDGSNTLKRTKSRSRPGEEKQVKATIKLNSGGLRYLNCARIAMNAAGVDLTVGNDGPVQGATVSWMIGRREGEGAMASAKNALIQYHSGNITRTKTNDDGEVIVTIEGKPQKYDLPPDAEEVKKPATIKIKYSLKESSLTQDLVDAVSSLASGPAGVAAELLTRMVPFYSFLDIEVVDWAADYKIDFDQAGVRYTAVKCGGPTGQWDIDITGKIGMGASVRGSMFATIDEQSLRGPFGSRMQMQAPGVTSEFMPETVFGGEATFLANDKQLYFRSTKMQGGTTDPGQIFKDSKRAGRPIRTVTGHAPLAPFAIPVQIGSYPDECPAS